MGPRQIIAMSEPLQSQNWRIGLLTVAGLLDQCIASKVVAAKTQKSE